MAPLQASLENPLVEGIKVIGVGKHGSKPLSAPQIEDIARYLQEEEVIRVQKGAFFGSLLAKGVTPEEQKLLLALHPDAVHAVETLYDHLCPDAPENMRAIGIRLLQKLTLSKEEARQLGLFLYSDVPGESFRGMAASMLRIRYETEEEYHGLMEAAHDTYTQGFKEAHSSTKPLVQLAEPFDGVEHSYMITPLLAHALGQAGYDSIVAVGRSSGPKLTLNALDLYQAFNSSFLRSNLELEQPASNFGWVLDQQVLSPALDQWVERRRLIFKRPFLATLEKVLNPCKAQILITSVFHITYIDKMIKLAGMAGFKGVIVLKRGLEGTLAPSLAKASGITCAVLQADGAYISQVFETNQEELSYFRAESDEIVADLKLEDNVHLIREYNTQGFTGNVDFDKRVQLATHLYKQGLKWIEENLS